MGVAIGHSGDAELRSYVGASRPNATIDSLIVTAELLGLRAARDVHDRRMVGALHLIRTKLLPAAATPSAYGLRGSLLRHQVGRQLGFGSRLAAHSSDQPFTGAPKMDVEQPGGFVTAAFLD